MTLDPNEVEAAKKVTAQVKRVITSSIDDGFCQVIGSHSTGLAMPWSDIDLAIVLPAIQEDAAAHHKSLTGRKYQKAYNKILLRLQRVFAQDFNFAGDSRHIYARVPIVRATHKRTNLEVQVQVQTDLGQQQQHVLAYMAEFPTLRPLYFVLRSCLELRHLHVTYEGGLGSYPILIMIVNALKHASGRFEPHDVANQLLHVLDFYAKCDLYHTGFSADPPRVFPKASVALTAEERMLRAADPVRRGIDSIAKPNRLEPYLLCLQDPADPNNDLGRKSYAIKHIQATFAMARETMLKAMRGWDRHRHLSLMNAMRGFLDPLVCANYRHFDIHRDKLKEYGDPESDGVGKWRIERPLKDLGDGEPKLSAREMLAKVIEVDNRKATAKKSQEEQTKIRENM